MRAALILLSSLLTFSVFCRAETPEYFRWVSFSDLKKSPGFNYAQDLDQQVSRELSKRGYGPLANFRFQQLPTALDNRTETVPVVITIGAKPELRLFLKAILKIEDHGHLIDMEITRTIPIKETHFSVRVALTQLKVVIEDVQNDIHFMYPLGSPGFDQGFTPRSEGHTVFLIPMTRGMVVREASEAARTNPHYYKGKPFLRIFFDKEPMHLFGFHISPWTDDLERGFVSAGCMRLQERDLVEFHEILRYGGNSHMPLQMMEQIPETFEHPYPKLQEFEIVYQSRCKEGRMVFLTCRLHGQQAPMAELFHYQGYWPTNSAKNTCDDRSGFRFPDPIYTKLTANYGDCVPLRVH